MRVFVGFPDCPHVVLGVAFDKSEGARSEVEVLVVGLVVIGYDLTVMSMIFLTGKFTGVFVQAFAFDGEVGFGNFCGVGVEVFERG